MVDSDEIMPRALARLTEAGIRVTEFSLHLPSLDEVFFTLTGAHTDPEEKIA
jgi:oleandomycin transport system ATP-binding protein